MTTFGIVDTGFNVKRLADILSDLKAGLATVQDPTTGEYLTPDLLDEDDPLIQLTDSFADALSVCWEQLQLVYNQFDPLKNTGAGQSGTIQINGIKRGAGSYSQVAVTITGTPNTILPAGRKITTITDVPIFTLPETTFGESGIEVVIATCTEKGPFTAGAGELVKILTPVSGWTGVSNSLDATPGSYEESDTEARARQQLSTSKPAQTIIEALAAGLNDIENVTFARVYQNIELTEDIRGIPGKAVAAVVIGGDDEDIAQVLYDKVAAGGCSTFGSDEEIIYDTNGISYPMKFTRPATVDVSIDVAYTVVNSQIFPSNGETMLKEALILWASVGSTSISSQSTIVHSGYIPGKNVVATELYAPCYTVPGITIDSIEVTAGMQGPDSITIEWDEIAAFDSDDITISEGGGS